MKKLILLLAAAALLLTGCKAATPLATTAPTETPAATQVPAEASATTPAEEPTVAVYEPAAMRIGGLKGATSMGIVSLMEAAEAGTAANTYTFTLAGAADELTPKLLQGELDMAMVPANLSAILYNNTEGAVQLLAVNTLGVTYIVETGHSIETLADLKGRTLYATGKGAIPEYTLRYLLAQSGLDPDKDVTIEWKSEPTEVATLLSAEENAVAMLPQPYVTAASGQVEGLHIAVNLSEAWDALDNGSAMITGVLAVRRDFADAHPQQLAAFLEEYRSSVEFVNGNPAEAGQLIEKFGIAKAAVAEKALPYCNIIFQIGDEMAAKMQAYLQILYDQNPKAVGGKLPEENFYYAAETVTK